MRWKDSRAAVSCDTKAEMQTVIEAAIAEGLPLTPEGFAARAVALKKARTDWEEAQQAKIASAVKVKHVDSLFDCEDMYAMDALRADVRREIDAAQAAFRKAMEDESSVERYNWGQYAGGLF